MVMRLAQPDELRDTAKSSDLNIRSSSSKTPKKKKTPKSPNNNNNNNKTLAANCWVIINKLEDTDMLLSLFVAFN